MENRDEADEVWK